MGSWGVTAHESDCGLDLRFIIADKYLKKLNNKCFAIKDALELLRAHIIDEFYREHIKMLCGVLEQAINEGGDGRA